MEKIYDVDYDVIVINCSQFGCCYFLMDDNNVVFELFVQVIKIREEYVGDFSDKVLCLFNKGVVYFKMNWKSEVCEVY